MPGFTQSWGLNPGPCAYEAGSVPADQLSSRLTAKCIILGGGVNYQLKYRGDNERLWRSAKVSECSVFIFSVLFSRQLLLAYMSWVARPGHCAYQANTTTELHP